jgi:hypothetical protein
MTIFSFKRDSYKLSEDERKVLLMMLDFFKYEIPDGNGSYLAMLDLENVDFYWSPAMALTDDGVFGSWSFACQDKVFIRPSENSMGLASRLKTMKLSGKEKDAAERILSYEGYAFNQFKNLNLDNELLKFVIYLCEGDGAMLSTVFHELYHKWQFNVSKFLYIVNFFAFLFTGYELSTKNKFSIEGDVRRYIDNEELHSKIRKFYCTFYQFLYAVNRLEVEKDEAMKAELENELETLKQDNFRYFIFCEKMLKTLQE